MANAMSPELLALLQSGNYTPSNSADWQKPWGGGAQQMGRDDSASGSGWISGMGNAYYDPASNSYFVPQYQVNQTGGEDGTTSLGPLIGYKNFDNSPAIQEQGHVNRLYKPDGSFDKTFTSSKYQVDPGEKLTMAFIAAVSAGAAAGAMGAGAGGGAGAGAGPGSAGWGMDLGMGGLAGDGVAATAVGGAGTAGPGMAGWGADLGMEGLAGTVGTGGVGFTPATGAAGGGGMWETIKSGASSLLPGGGGSGGSLGGYGQYIGPLASLYGAKQGSDAAKDAANAQIASTREANALAAAMFDKQVALQEPFRQGGMAGMNKLLSGLGLAGDPSAAGYGSFAKDFSMADYEADPGYAFRQSEGEKAIQRASSAAGRSDSGRAYKDLMRFNQGEASQEYGNAFNRFQINRAAKINPLQSLMGAGQSSANTLTQAAGNYGQQAGQNIIGAGNAAAAGKVGSANAINSGIGSAWNMYQNNQLMNKFFPNGA